MNMHNVFGESAKKRHQFHSTCGRYVYHIAIIDYLTRFNFQKRLESWYKVQWKNQDRNKVSCVEPILYGNRFIKFMSQHVIVNDDMRKEVNMQITDSDLEFEKLQDAFNSELAKYYLDASVGEKIDENQ